jgi:hypothetical protein
MQNDLIDKHIKNPSWAEVLRLYSGLFDAQNEREEFILNLAETDILLAVECKSCSVIEEKKIVKGICNYAIENVNEYTNYSNYHEIAKMITAIIELKNYSLAYDVLLMQRMIILPSGKRKDCNDKCKYRILRNIKQMSSSAVFELIEKNLFRIKNDVLLRYITNNLFVSDFSKKVIFDECVKRKLYTGVSSFMGHGFKLETENIIGLLGICKDLDYTVFKFHHIPSELKIDYIKKKLDSNEVIDFNGLYIILLVAQREKIKESWLFLGILNHMKDLKVSYSSKKFNKINPNEFSVVCKIEIVIELIHFLYENELTKQDHSLARSLRDSYLQNKFNTLSIGILPVLKLKELKTRNRRDNGFNLELEFENFIYDFGYRNCIVTNFIESRVFVKIENENRTSSIYIGQLTNKRLEKISDFEYNGDTLHVGQKLIAKVIDIDEKYGINLSLKNVDYIEDGKK